MELRTLGRTGIMVSRLCFGSLTIGPFQANLTVAEGARVLRHALEQGVNFIDTADSYDTYPYIRAALGGWTGEVVIASKSYDYTAGGMARSLERACQELGREWVDIFLLHEQETALTLAGHREALDYLLSAKQRGQIRAVGISTHSVAAVEAALGMPEIEVIHPLINCRGIGITNGGRKEMLGAVEKAHAAGKGIYAMKALGGGHLISMAPAALGFVLGLPAVDAVAVGMQSQAEVDMNVALFQGQPVPAELATEVGLKPRRLHVEDWCQGCGTCVPACPQGALQVRDGRVEVDAGRCIFCSYCARVCPDFCLKVV
ncbi:MAG: 4Fe-4S dicluster domain-containing protein [Clostridia bacterium]|nr:MAG: 4Fe-4S dicluster domain-containing protein [Clostridia bacterium]